MASPYPPVFGVIAVRCRVVWRGNRLRSAQMPSRTLDILPLRGAPLEEVAAALYAAGDARLTMLVSEISLDAAVALIRQGDREARSRAAGELRELAADPRFGSLRETAPAAANRLATVAAMLHAGDDVAGAGAPADAFAAAADAIFDAADPGSCDAGDLLAAAFRLVRDGTAGELRGAVGDLADRLAGDDVDRVQASAPQLAGHLQALQAVLYVASCPDAPTGDVLVLRSWPHAHRAVQAVQTTGALTAAQLTDTVGACPAGMLHDLVVCRLLDVDRSGPQLRYRLGARGLGF